MLLTFMFHHVTRDLDKYEFSNSEYILTKHIEYLADNCNIVMPGDELSKKKINVCLTFDDAAFDFYFYIYPLLERLKIRALLAVPTGFIKEESNLKYEERLQLGHRNFSQYDNPEGFCTWNELREMSNSGLIQIASHGVMHVNLLRSREYKQELELSKNTIENKLNVTVDCMVFPYGMVNEQIKKYASSLYRYLFAVGSMAHTDWNGLGGLIYRIPNDRISDPYKAVSFYSRLRYHLHLPKIIFKNWIMLSKPNLFEAIKKLDLLGF